MTVGLVGHVLRHSEELHHTIIEGKWKDKDRTISQLKKDLGINTYTGLNRIAEDRKKWRTKLNVVNQPIPVEKKKLNSPADLGRESYG